MTQRKTLVLVAAIVATGLVAPAAVFAHNGEDHGDKPKTLAETRTKTAEELQKQAEQKREEIQQKTDQLRERVKTQREAAKTKLEGQRKDKCEQRQSNINKIAGKSTTQSKKHLGTFQKIEERVKQFVTDKNLTVENYDTLVANVDAKEAAAIAAVDVAAETSFDCDTTDATNPGSVVKTLMQSQHSALKDYRTAIKDLIVAVKQSATKEQSNEG
jgi:TolA-binding protein